MRRCPTMVAVVLALIAVSCSGDDSGGADEEVRGPCETRVAEPTEGSEGEAALQLDPLDSNFHRNLAFARVTLDFEERVGAGGSADFLVFHATVDEALLDPMEGPALPGEFRVVTTVGAEDCPDERLTRSGARVVATFGSQTLLPGQPDAEWWMTTAWVEEDGLIEYVLPHQPSREVPDRIFAAYAAADLPAVSETEQLLTWARERRSFTVPRGEEESSLFGPMELALGRHWDQLDGFERDWGECGTTFATTDRDQRLAILATPSDPGVLASGEIPMVADVNDGVWDVELFFGANMMTGWCSDVVNEESTSRIDHRWAATEGIVEFFGPLEDGVAVIRIRGLVVSAPIGEPYAFPDIEIRHNCWECVDA